MRLNRTSFAVLLACLGVALFCLVYPVYVIRPFRPQGVREVAGAAWATGQGAIFVDAGQWKRPQWFPKPGETDWLQSVVREVRGVRERVGVCDVSTLG